MSSAANRPQQPAGGSRRRLGPALAIGFASGGFLVLRFLLTPARIKLLTSLLSKEDYGALTLVSTTAAFLMMAGSLGSFDYLLVRLPGRPRAEQLGALRTIMLAFGAVAAAIALVTMAVLAWLSQRGTLALGAGDIAACGLLLVLMVHLNQRCFFLLGTQDYVRSRLTQLLYTDLWFLPLLFFVWRGGLSVTTVLWIWVAWYAVTAAVTRRWVGLGGAERAAAPRGTLGEVLRFGLPLTPMILGDLLARVQDRYILLAFTDLGAVASYSLAMSIGMIAVQLGDAALDILVTRFFRIRNAVAGSDRDVLAAVPELRRTFTVMLRYCLLIGGGAALGQVWLAEPVIRLLSSDVFLDAVPLLVWLAPFALVSLLYIVFGRVFIALHWNREMGWAAFVTAFANLGLNLLLVPRLHGAGAALAAWLGVLLLASYLGWRIRAWRWVDARVLHGGRLVLFFVAAGLAFRFIGAHEDARPIVRLLAAAAAYVALVPVMGLFTRTDAEVFLGGATLADAEVPGGRGEHGAP